MLLTDTNSLGSPRISLCLRRETTILHVADSHNVVVGTRRRVPRMTVPSTPNITTLSTQISTLGGIWFQRPMKVEENPVVVLFGLLYGDCMLRRLHAERAEDLCLHLPSAPCLELQKISNHFVTEVKQNNCWLRTLLKSCCFLCGLELIQRA